MWKRSNHCISYLGSEGSDHMNSRYFTGDLVVANIILSNCWTSGHLAASKALKRAGLSCDFATVLSQKGVDFLCPHGDNIYPGIATKKDHSLPDEQVTAAKTSSTTSEEVDIEHAALPCPFISDISPHYPSSPEHPTSSTMPDLSLAPVPNYSAQLASRSSSNISSQHAAHEDPNILDEDQHMPDIDDLLDIVERQSGFTNHLCSFFSSPLVNQSIVRMVTYTGDVR
jgi:hypothetical protein